MDNLSYRIADATIDVPTLLKALHSAGINVSHKTLPKTGTELIMFSLPIGKYAARWMFRLNLTDRTITCSGGVTKTFFGHNVWVFKNEATQLEAIISIIGADLQKIGGIELPSTPEALTVDDCPELTHFGQ